MHNASFVNTPKDFIIPYIHTLFLVANQGLDFFFSIFRVTQIVMEGYPKTKL